MMEKSLRAFLGTYIGQGTENRDIVTQEAVDGLVAFAICDGIEQKIIDYGIANPNAPFWDFLSLLKPGLHGVTQEELLEDDD